MIMLENWLTSWQTAIAGIVSAAGGVVWLVLRIIDQAKALKRAREVADAQARAEIAQAEAVAAEAEVREARADVTAAKIRQSDPLLRTADEVTPVEEKS